MKCPSGKRRFDSENEAVNALIEARIHFPHNKAINVYNCSDCGLWHLTSQGVMNDRLKQELENGNIQKQIDSFLWGDKFR